MIIADRAGRGAPAVLRALTLSVKRRDFVEAACVLGESRVRVMFFELSAPVGQPATSNYGRYNNAQAQAAFTPVREHLRQRDAEQRHCGHLQTIYSAEQPTIPLSMGPTGTSTARRGSPAGHQSNAYMDPAPNDPELPYILMHLKAAS